MIEKNSRRKRLFVWLLAMYSLLALTLHAQEPRVFTRADFDLVGKVKRSLVITNYGKEAFDFTPDGLLNKITTVYSESDYDITFYKYLNGLPIEKRLEIYREDKLDRQTSIANIFEVDTLLKKIVKEQIYSYQKEFLDQFEYGYDKDGNLVAVTRTSNEGIDETLITYDTLKGEITKTIKVNGIIEKSVRTAEKKEKGQRLEVELIKTYLNGEPFTATETFRDTLGRKVRETAFNYDPDKATFVRSEELQFTYGENGFLTSKVRKAEKQESRQEFIYQFDAHEPPNWTKEIITPQNEYTTRRINYYPEEVPEGGEGGR